MNHGANFYVQKENLPQVVFAELANDVNKAVELFRAEKSLKIQRDLALANTSAKSLEETLNFCSQAILDVSGMEGVGIYLSEEKNLNLATFKDYYGKYTGEKISP